MVQWLSVECLSKQWNSNRLPSDSSGPEICPQGPCFPVFPHLSAQMCWGCWQSRLHSFPLRCQQGLLHVIRVSASAWPFWPQSLKTSLAHDLAYFYHAPHLWMAHKYTGYLFNPYLSAFFFPPRRILIVSVMIMYLPLMFLVSQSGYSLSSEHGWAWTSLGDVLLMKWDLCATLSLSHPPPPPLKAN